ncbi:mediator complex subunit MED14-domain-containing protein [Xylariaceae sp. FL0804]|nr:mediator complex subunit MED14-domain-containing protein [Xylariaceae sp. FL0804]
MPGVVMMENGARDTLPTNHNRSNGQLAQGGASSDSQPSTARQNGPPGKAREGSDGASGAMVNGNDNGMGDPTASFSMASDQPPQSGTSRMNDLPDEIQHITQGYVPLGLLLSRLAQQTHNELCDEILALAKMQLPAPAMNGNSAHADGADDTSRENLDKKVRLLNFVQEKHGEWVKALVIANWSRRAEPVSKLIDLMHHINKQRKIYDDALDYMINIKRDLTYARLPNPDLRTALQVLSTGQAPWMPDLNYIEPPPITPKEQIQWIENINTLLSIRLNLDEHENLPSQFQDYSIDCGRVTFRVPGEFEVDLTIADEDFEKQFWFIDFRFAFTPAPAELSEYLRTFLEQKVNVALETDGLSGCYKFLHEFILTHKVSEYVRQAVELTRGRWVDTLRVERLNRAMSIQYWSSRFPPDAPKSWIILGVHGGGAALDRTRNSHLSLRWFRDNKEIKDTEIPLENETISTEALLQLVIGRHIQHILSGIHKKLKVHGRFVNREAVLALSISNDNPEESMLKMQLGPNYDVEVKLSPITGMVGMKPQSPVTWKGEQKLNWHSRDPIQDGLACLESVRCHYTIDELKRRGKSSGWSICKGPVRLDEVKSALNTRDQFQLIWLQRAGLPKRWYTMVSLSLSGDKWWLIRTTEHSTGPRISSFTPLPLTSGSPVLSEGFFSKLTFFNAAMMTHIANLEVIHQRKMEHRMAGGVQSSLPSGMEIPTVLVKLASIMNLQQSQESDQQTPAWAEDYVQLTYKGVDLKYLKSEEVVSGSDGTAVSSQGEVRLHALVDARIKVADPARFGLLKGNVERDVAFNERLGVFAFLLEAEAGCSILDTLAHRLQALGRLADCIDAIRRSDRDVQCEEITLSKVAFSYSDQLKDGGDQVRRPKAQRWKAALDLGADKMKLVLEPGNPQLRNLDIFQRLLNSQLGFIKLPFFLSSTLALQQALDRVEDAWRDLEMNNQGRVEIFAAHLDWFNVRYTMPGPNKTGAQRLTLQIRLRKRQETMHWQVTRHEAGAIKQPNDEFKEIVSKVWASEKRSWTYLNDSASASTDHLVGELIKAIDEAIRPLATRSPAVSKQAPQPRTSTPKNNSQHRTSGTSKARPQQQQQPPGNIVILDD